MITNKDNSDKTHDEYIEEEKIINEFNEDNEDNEVNDNTRNICTDQKETTISLNCNLKVDFNTKNKMIYLSPGKSQYFTLDVVNCSGEVTVKYNGISKKEGIYGNLGLYHIVQSGIIVETYRKLDPKKHDILSFTAIDECTEDRSDFVVVFSTNSYDICY